MFANLLVDRVTGVPSVDGRSHEVLGRVLQPVYERVRLPAARRANEPAVPLRTWRHLAGNTHGRRPPKGYRRITWLLYSCIAGRIVLALSSSSYDTRCYFNVRSKADISQLNLPHGTDN